MDIKWKNIDKKDFWLTLFFFVGATLLLVSASALFSIFVVIQYGGSQYRDSLLLSSIMLLFMGVLLLAVFREFGRGRELRPRIDRAIARLCRRVRPQIKIMFLGIVLFFCIGYWTSFSRLYYLNLVVIDPYDLLLPLFAWTIYLLWIDLSFNREEYYDLYIVPLQTGGQVRIKPAALVILIVFILLFFLYVTFLYSHSLRTLFLLYFILGTPAMFFLSAWYDTAARHWRQERWTVQAVSAMLNGQPLPCLSPEEQARSLFYQQLVDLRSSMDAAIQEQVASERTKAELITNVSHDLKTPITSLVSYVELLKREEDLSPAARDYVNILETKAQRLQTLVQDVFDISKAVSGQLPIQPEVMDYRRLLEQITADMAELTEASPCAFRVQLPEEALPIFTDGERMYRVFQNLIQNALQYSLPASRIFLTLERREENAVACICNTSREELSPDIDYSERFLRGDSSRSSAGSGLGLSIARTFTERCGGRFRIQVDHDQFSVFVTFPLSALPLQEAVMAETGPSFEPTADDIAEETGGIIPDAALEYPAPEPSISEESAST